MQTKNQIKSLIEKSIKEDLFCRIYFRTNRNPIYGKFVATKDHDNLFDKGFIRFSGGIMLERFNKSKRESDTLLHNYSSFYYIKTYPNDASTKN
jgi:hypothetical protein